jgi:hypothetical protein
MADFQSKYGDTQATVRRLDKPGESRRSIPGDPFQAFFLSFFHFLSFNNAQRTGE